MRWSANRKRAAGEGGLAKGLAGVDEAAAADLLEAYEALDLGWFWGTDAEGRLDVASEALRSAVSLDHEALIGREFATLFQTEEDEDSGSVAFLFAKRRAFRSVAVRTRGDAARQWAISGRPKFGPDGQFLGFRGHGADVTTARRAADESSRLAMYDPLTGLANRRRISDVVEGLIAGVAVQKRPFAVLLVDLDRFKQVNDTLGHPTGDLLLKQVGERLAKISGDAERVARIGGDEFQLVVPGVEDRGALGTLAGEIIESLSQPYSITGSRCIIGASIGIVISPYDGTTAEQLFRNADLALYAAKSGGRGRFRFFSNDLLEAAEDRRVLEHDLRDALSRGELEVHYQPQVNAQSNEVTGFEALLRWNHPDRGAISPAAFVPIAEDANLIPQLGEWTLRQACQQAAKWPASLKVAVNVSPIQFSNPNLPQLVLSALSQSGLAPERLELEITESVFLSDSRETARMFAALKNLGVRLALDDFGTGYSSLGYLKTAPFDKIKIDQSFVRGVLDPGSRNRAIIASIVALASALGMETTAEGVETFDQLAAIGELSVSHVQGFLYSLPVSAEAVAQAVAEGGWVLKPVGPARQRQLRYSTFKRVGAVHGNHYYPVVLRNLSASGALIEGIVNVPVGTEFVIDFGDGQLVVATVRRSRKSQQGVQFEHPLVDDGDGGLCTRYRVSPLMLAKAGVLADKLKPNSESFASSGDGQIALPAFQTADGRRAVEVIGVRAA